MMTERPRNLDPAAIDAVIERLCAEAGPGKSISPVDVARHMAPENWRRHLAKIRVRARALAEQGRIEILRKGKPVGPDEVRGVIRLRVTGGSGPVK
jgi:hypothetical protein